MTPETEQQLLGTIYERLWQAITYNPSNTQERAFNTGSTFLHLAQGEILNPADFMNLLSPNNPAGELRATERFSRMVDVIPEIKADYTPSPNCVSLAYRQILASMDPNESSDPQQDELYERAYAFLFTDTITHDYTGKEVVLKTPSPRLQVYESNKLAYIQAISDYRSAYLNYDLNNPQQQREWLANAPLFELAINQAYNKWRREGAAQVEQAQAALSTITNSRTHLVINSTLNSILAEAVQIINTAAFASVDEGGTPWYLAYSLPTNWVVSNSNDRYSYLKLTSSRLNTEANTKFNLHGGGVAWTDGLWSIEDSSGTHADHLGANSIEISARIGIVRICRLWFNALALKIAKQFADILHKEALSSSLLVPTIFITAHDIRIKGDFTTKDREYLEHSLTGTKSVGFGPIRLSGEFAHSLSTELLHAREENGTIIAPGIQILAWVSEVVPSNASMTDS